MKLYYCVCRKTLVKLTYYPAYLYKLDKCQFQIISYKIKKSDIPKLNEGLK